MTTDDGPGLKETGLDRQQRTVGWHIRESMRIPGSVWTGSHRRRRDPSFVCLMARGMA